MLEKWKGFVAASVMSMQKLNDVFDNQKTTKDENIVQEEQVKKQEINLISQKRFYDLLNKADDIMNKKHEYHNQKILEGRGINEDFKSFKNIIYYPSVHEEIMGLTQLKYKFQTNNKLNEYASDVHVKNQSGMLTLNFLINLNENPSFKIHKDELINLEYFKIQHYAKLYHFNILRFLGVITPNPFEIFMVFEAESVLNGEYSRELSDMQQKTTKSELIDPKIFIYTNQISRQ